jgi:thiol-disulfide isomerase/thioredoxin
MRFLFIALLALLPLSAQDYDWQRVVPGSSYCPRDYKYVTDSRVHASNRGGEWIKPEEEHSIPVAERKSANTYGFSDVDGKMATIESLKGKLVIVAFFATSCEPSMRMLLDVAQLQPKGQQFGFEILPVHMESWINIGQMTRKWAEVRKINYYRSGLGKHGLTQLSPDLTAMPTVFVIDRNGGIAHIYCGYAENKLSGILRHYLGEKPALPAMTQPTEKPEVMPVGGTPSPSKN